MTKFEQIVNELNRKGFKFFVRRLFENGQEVSKTLSKIVIDIKVLECGRKYYYANGKLTSKRLATKLGVQI